MTSRTPSAHVPLEESLQQARAWNGAESAESITFSEIFTNALVPH